MPDDPVIRLNAALEGRYRIERQLGEGGMATVYLADDLRHERKVALKVLKPELAAVVGADRFLVEIKTTANLQHPHILPLFDSGEADGFLFYVMPYVEGESLRARLDREHQLPVEEAVRIATDVAEALEYAHRQGVIHRDIKPANILLSQGRPLVSDFGIALALGAAGAGRLTETGLSLGTPHYMSPEQATGDLSVGAATDIYALGCVLYEMLVGEPPFTGSTPQAVLGKIVTGEADPVAKHRRSVPTNVDAAIRKALEKVPADRFATSADLARALADEDFRLVAAAEGSDARWKERWAWAVPVTAVALSLSLGYVAGTAMRPAAEGPMPVPANLQILLPPGTFLPLDADYPLLAVSPDGSVVVFVAERDGVRELYSRALRDSVPRPISGTEGALAPVFSPDGESIAYFAGGMVYVVRASGGPPVPVHQISGPGVSRGLAWASDARLVIVSSSNAGLDRGLIAQGRVGRRTDWETLTPASTPATWPAAVFGTNDILFGRRSDSGRGEDVAVVSLESAVEYTLVNGANNARYSQDGHLLFSRGELLYAVRYDPERRELSGRERDILRGVARAGYDVSHYAVGGSVLAYVPGGEISLETELVWVDRQGGVVEVIADGRRYGDPRISPDGTRVALTVTDGPNLDVWALDISRGTLQPLTRHPGEDFGPEWRPDGSALSLSSEVAEDEGELGPGLAWIPELGGETLRLMLSPEPAAWEFPTSWTPDGQAIVATVRRQDTSADIVLVSLERPNELVPLVQTSADEVGGRVSPDGRWLVYVSNQSGRNEIWLRPFPGPGTPVQVSNSGGTEPVWSRDSREIFYRQGGDVLAVSLSPDDAPLLGAPAQLFSGRFEPNLFGGQAANFDVSDDGTRFLMVRRAQDARPTVINVVLDWPSVLSPDESD